MKKAQILSAIALAFALGVTPVIATVNTASAFTVEDTKNDVEGSATAADVKNAIAAIRANGTYKNMVTLHDAIEAITNPVDSDAAYAQINTDTYSAVRSAIEAIDTDDATSAELTKLTNEQISLSEKINKIVKRAKNVDYYNVIAPIYIAYDNEDSAAFRTAVLNFNATNKFKNNTVVVSNNTQYNDTTVLGNINTVIESVLGAGAPTNYHNLATAVNEAETDNASYNKGLNLILNALKADGVMTKAGKLQLATWEKGNNNGSTTFVLTDLAGTAVAQNNAYTFYNEWNAVYNKVEDAEDSIFDEDCEENYDTIISLAKAYADVTGNNTQTVEEIAATLVGYKAPAAQNTLTEGPVTVTGAFPADLKLSVVKSDKKIAAFGDAKYGMWDINLIDAKNNKVTYNGSVMVTIAVPEGIDATKSSVYYVNDQGKVEKLAARVENGKMVFTTSHFSLYAIVEDNGKNFGINAPDTGIVMNTESGASTTVAMVAGVATALTAAGAGVVAYRNARRSTRK